MSKWIIKKTINENLKKNQIIEETNVLHTEAVLLNEYSGGFSLFSKGKNFITESGRVVKLMGKRSDFDDHIQEYVESNVKTFYKWKGEPKANLFAGRLYEKSQVKEWDRSLKLDLGLSKLYLIDNDQVVVVQGSRQKFNDYVEIINETVEPEKPLLIPPKSQEYVTEIIKEEKLVGPAGPRGFPGEQGPMGDAGPVGPVGPPGERGEKGDPGPQGEPGKDGIDGKDGERGQKGERGEQGPQGIPGEAAEKGERGPQGPPGERGKRGPLGYNGQKGEKGDPGEEGPAGPEGPQGPPGEKGEPGKRGPKGVAGKDGVDGKDGEQGPPGEKGDPGNNADIKVKYPLQLNDESGLITLDKKFFEKLLSGGEVNQQLMNKFINAASSGGGGVDIKKDDIIKGRSIPIIDFTGDHFDITVDGRKGDISLSNVPRMFAGPSADVAVGVYATGDFHLNTDTETLYVRTQGFWVEV